MDQLFDSLFPICRSITGEGLRETLSLLTEHLPLENFAVPTGTRVFDWEIPQEWVIRDAWLKDPHGNVIADFKVSNLHIVNYSEPIHVKLSLDEMKKHLYTVPHLPKAIPYVTSYYKRRWGFCISHEVLEALPEGEYEAFIDSSFIQGELNYGHSVLPGKSDREVLISSYICHPSLANNELSGPLVATFLYKRIAQWQQRRFTYRFVFLPETIGSISYLHRFGDHLKQNLHAGLVLTCLGGEKSLSYKLSRSGFNPIDRIWKQMLAQESLQGNTRHFTPEHGSDERQYCSPGFNLPVGQMSRMVYGAYPGYHNSLDTKETMTIEALQHSVDDLEKILLANEAEGYYINRFPYGEVKLDKHGLYPDMNSSTTFVRSNNQIEDNRVQLNRTLTFLNYADGEHLLTEIADLCRCSIESLLPYVKLLSQKGIIDGPYFEKGVSL
ncbi:DUF4910 domain-containing protein [Cohnella herbarum]|uniref:DUF4910 domain-containing protein n=1 Tax=Cohnella herbarum TaxID=2728023 RepID=A0A7Z2ZMP7_9BACL|nr:DUF4910 domain-containing protein [Cohnella herbarum]QJD85204.1 DUF4910 domain-containing protein [Cohnella herbarum]